MSLLEKASNERKPLPEPKDGRSSLFARALASSSKEAGDEGSRQDEAESLLPLAAEPEPASFAKERASDVARRIAELPAAGDSLVALWDICSSQLPLAALALFLPQGDFLALAARSGFPAGRSDHIPLSTAPAKDRGGESLSSEASALLAPLLGVAVSMELRATSLWSTTGSLVGLWVYHAPSIEGQGGELAAVSAVLEGCAPLLQDFPLERAAQEPLSQILEASLRFQAASLLRFDLSLLFESEACPSGIERDCLRSAFLASCRKLLGDGGFALACGGSSVVCVLGSTSDAELALFQFSKTLKRLLPFFASAGFPPAAARSLAPAAAGAVEELTSFLSA